MLVGSRHGVLNLHRAIVRTLRTVYDMDDRPVEVQDTVAAADKHQFRYEVRMR